MGTDSPYTGAEFTVEDRLYANIAEPLVRDQVLPKLEQIEEGGVMEGLLTVDVPERNGGLGLGPVFLR